jgi:hypothetical protein
VQFVLAQIFRSAPGNTSQPSPVVRAGQQYLSVYTEFVAGTHIASDTPRSIEVIELDEMNKIATGTFDDWVELVQSEYSEMPGLHLSKRQAQRLWNLDARSCDVIFEALEASHFLKRTLADSYVRADIDY